MIRRNDAALEMEHDPTRRRASQREFFDAQALAAADLELPKVARPYEAARGQALYHMEVAYESLGDLTGKRVLDVGCFESPVELTDTSNGVYDIVWCAGFLHHVLDRLDQICSELHRLVAPNGFVLVSEPVRLSRATKMRVPPGSGVPTFSTAWIGS